MTDTAATELSASMSMSATLIPATPMLLATTWMEHSNAFAMAVSVVTGLPATTLTNATTVHVTLTEIAPTMRVALSVHAKQATPATVSLALMLTSVKPEMNATYLQPVLTMLVATAVNASLAM